MRDTHLVVMDDFGSTEARRASRRKLLLAARIETGKFSGPVRIRDLSECGALLEGATLPVGERLTLRRIDLEVACTIIWAASSRCGVRFEEVVSVADWIAGKGSGRSLPQPSVGDDNARSGTARGQVRVDRLQSAIRAGAPALGAETRPCAEASLTDSIEQRLAAELGYVQRLLESIGDELIDEPVLVHRHGAALQQFDVAAQVLGHLAAILASPDRAAAINAIGMHDLRARLTRKRMF